MICTNAAFGDDPGRWPLPAATLGRGAVAPRGRRRRAGPLRQRLRRSRFCSAGPPRRAAGVAGAQHPGVLLASARLARHGPRLGRPRPCGGRRRSPKGRVDALIGLAADALGVGRFAASAAALRRAQGLLDGGPPRLAVRLAWVSAELAMATGDGAAAVGHAERAVELAAALGSARHRVKSDVVLAAALCSDGQARPVARGGRRRAGHHAASRNRSAELGVGVPARRKSAAGTTPLIKSSEFATSPLIRCGAEAACC